MGAMSRRAKIYAAAVGVAAAGITAGLIVVFAGGAGARPTRAEYLASAQAICRDVGRRLDRVEPPTDPASVGNFYESIGKALPLLREQERRIRALDEPAELETQLAQFFALTDRSLTALAEARRQASERALFPMVQALARFETYRDRAKVIAHALGFKC
jgi:hypothetical protein